MTLHQHTFAAGFLCSYVMPNFCATVTQKYLIRKSTQQVLCNPTVVPPGTAWRVWTFALIRPINPQHFYNHLLWNVDQSPAHCSLSISSSLVICCTRFPYIEDSVNDAFLLAQSSLVFLLRPLILTRCFSREQLLTGWGQLFITFPAISGDIWGRTS